MDMLTLPQLWAVLGLLFLIAELLSISFVFVFLGVGALVTALTSWLGITPAVNAQLLCFSLVTVGSLALFRRSLRTWFRQRSQQGGFDEHTGQRVTVSQTIPSQGEGRVTYRGSEWIAISETGLPIAAGHAVTIQRLDGIKVVVKE